MTLRVDVVDEDFLVEAATEDALIIGGKCQTANGAFMFSLHRSRVPFAAVLIKGPQSDGFVCTGRDQLGPVVGEFN